MNADQLHTRLVNGLRLSLSKTLGEKVDLIETHISSLLLAGPHVYKLKKPVNFGFLDFSTLARRKLCCDEELRLNRRLAPELYLDVVTISGTVAQPEINGEGEILDYAVKMERFLDDHLLSDHPKLLDASLVDRLADRLVSFHESIERSDPSQSFGHPALVLKSMQQNFEQIREVQPDLPESRFARLETWTHDNYRRLLPQLEARREDGFVRECHGDLHLGNIAFEQGELLLFDGIEFNPQLRWIDTCSELAFLLMDMEEKGRHALSYRFLDRYLMLTGDYDALRLLRFYQVYRAMVRAKVSAIGLSQHPDGEKGRALLTDYSTYLDIADRYTQLESPLLAITHGFSASGKSSVSLELLQRLPAIRLRSDVERKRLAGLPAVASSGEIAGEGIYSRECSDRTYRRLHRLADTILQSGFSVIVDATFLRRPYRAEFIDLAINRRIVVVILDFELPRAELERRILKRAQVGDKVSEADVKILQKQFQEAEPLTAAELDLAIDAGEGLVKSKWLVDELGSRLTRGSLASSTVRQPITGHEGNSGESDM